MESSAQQNVHLVECPRDAMQGWEYPISTEDKIEYLQALLSVGFPTLDCGSFVSPKAIPQMADTKEVLPKLQLDGNTKLLTIVANQRGAEDAVCFDEVTYLGYPFSVSETFQQLNANASLEQSLHKLEGIQELCIKNKKTLVVYLSMAFGNPYEDKYSEEIVLHWAEKIIGMDVQIISLADTVGLATADQVGKLTQKAVAAFDKTEIGVHLHSAKTNWQEKLDAALDAGCRRVDGALRGIGGCPMAGNALVGNMDTALIIPHLQEKNLLNPINEEALAYATTLAEKIFAS